MATTVFNACIRSHIIVHYILKLYALNIPNYFQSSPPKSRNKQPNLKSQNFGIPFKLRIKEKYYGINAVYYNSNTSEYINKFHENMDKMHIWFL